jgi:Protein of unknown function (DUF3015)
MRGLRSLLIGGALLATSNAWAVDGSTGCGPGWYVAKEHTFLSTTTRGTTNGVLWPLVLGGMTSGTSNCAKHSFVEDNRASEHFIAVNHEMIRQEAAQGEGEYLTSLALTFGCSKEVGPKFNQALQTHFDGLFAVPANPIATTRRIYEVVQKDTDLQRSCPVAPHLS